MCGVLVKVVEEGVSRVEKGVRSEGNIKAEMEGGGGNSREQWTGLD